jgi:hypothetical protein
MTPGRNEMKNGSDRFGVDPELIGRVFRYHLEAGVIRFGCYVPTRDEVATQPIEWLQNVVTDWFWESPEELAPDEQQCADVIRVLLDRTDADDPRIRSLIEGAPFPPAAP